MEYPKPPEEWMSTKGRGAKVVVLDSGFVPGTPHLYPAMARSFTGRNTTFDRGEHGTRVAQIIASMDPLMPGLSPACTLYVGEVVGQLERGWESLREALEWVISLRPDVVNMSFACPASDQVCDRYLHTLDQMGVICLASYNPYLHWPHSLPNVLSVGLHDGRGQCDVRTVGEMMVGMANGPDTFRGTSAASAIVAAVAACAKAWNPLMNRASFLTAITSRSGQVLIRHPVRSSLTVSH